MQSHHNAQARFVSSSFRVILHGRSKNHTFGWEQMDSRPDASRNQPGGLANLHGLGAPPGAEFVKQAAGMGLHRVFADEEPARDLAIAQPGGDEAENLQLARGDAELAPLGPVDYERAGWRRNFFDNRFRNRFLNDRFLNDDRGFLSGERQSQPDTESGKHGGDQRTVDLDRMLDDQEAILGQVQDHDQQAAAHAVEQDVAQRAATRTRGGFPGHGHGRHHIRFFAAAARRLQVRLQTSRNWYLTIARTGRKIGAR